LRIDAGAYVSADGEISTLHDGSYGELANGSTILAVNALELAGQIDGNGTLEIQSQGLLQIDPVQAAPDNSDARAVSVSGQTIQFDSAPDGASPADEKLKIGGAEVDSATFNAVIKGFALGDTIDLTGVGLADNWSFDGSTLTVTHDGITIGSLSLDGISADAKFDVASDGNGGTDITLNHPVIDTTHFSVQQNEDGSDTILGLQVSDSDPTAAQNLTISATTAGAPVSTVSPPSGAGSVDDINSELASGITYNPGSPQPQTDMVNVTVSDNFGASDTVHFVFNQGGQGPDISLTGTTGNDVIFATGDSDSLTGNGGQDRFVFAPTSGQTAAQHTVTDFNAHLDTIDLRQFTNISSTADALATATQQGNDTLLTIDSHDTILLKNMIVANLHASDFIVTAHYG
jgi:Ca2+-binding RTX toxin-like protein